MLRLSDNPMTPCRYSMFAAEQCPKALAWMASLALAAGRTAEATAWMVELIGSIVLNERVRTGFGTSSPAPRDTASTS